MDTGRYGEAEPLFRRALVIVEQADPRKLREEERPQYRDRALTTLGACLVELGEYDEAAALLEQSRTSKLTNLKTENHPSYALTLHWIAKLKFLIGDADGAEPLLRRAIEIRQTVWPLGHPQTASSQALLGELLLEQDRADDAEPILAGALEIDRTMLPVNHWHTAHAASLLGRCQMALGKAPEAEALLVEGAETLRLARGDADAYARGAITRLADFYRQTDRPELAKPLDEALRRSAPVND
jgi:tetratricopeptide (TPR) repeat protein